MKTPEEIEKFIIQEKENSLEISHPDHKINSIVEKKFVTYNYIKALEQRNAKLVEAKDNEMIEFAWWLLSKLGQYSDDKVAHFEGRYLEQWKKIKQ